MLRAFLLSVSLLAVPAAAQTSLPDISPDTLAADAAVTFADGRRDVEMRSFDPFEGRGEIQGEMWLRTSPGEIGHTGLRLPRGAVVEIEATYISPTDDPRDARGFERVAFASGQEAQLVRYRTDVLECSSRVRRTDYRDDYFRGVSHGLVMGIYGAYPRYRGFRDYGYTDYLGSRGYGRRGRFVRGRDRGVGNGVVLRDYRGDDGRAERRREPADTPPPVGTPRSVTPGIRTGTGFGPLATPIPSPTPRAPIATQPPAVERARRGQPTPAAPRRRRVVSGNPADAFPTPRAATPSRSDPSRSNPSRSDTSRSTPPRASAPPRTPKPPRHREIAPSSSKRPPTRQSARPSPRPGKQHDLYPPLEPVGGQCAVRESVGVFVPWERVDAARFDGLSLAMEDRDGREVSVWVPPNYIEGFRLATRRR